MGEKPTVERALLGLMCVDSSSERDNKNGLLKDTALQIMLPIIAFRAPTVKKICAYG